MADEFMTDDLAEIARSTLADYTRRAETFREQTRDHDVSQNIDALLSAIQRTPPFDILDIGCGPGRDLKSFAARGHRAIGLEGCPEFAAMAEAEGFDVWRQNFLALDLPVDRFDGLFANATLFHVPSRELPRLLTQFHATLRSGGAFFSSNPRGNNQEGWFNGRYCAYHDLDQWRSFLTGAGFEEVEHYYRPTGLPREQQPWLASVWRKK
jgi:SAM-dependent methyltransferase